MSTVPTPRSTVTLREITKDTLRPIIRLSVADAQKSFVADNAVSIAQAHFSPEAWFRAIYADETPVGFVMLSDEPAKPEYYLWRFMIDARHQGRGFGRQAIRLLVEHVRSRPNATELLTSIVEGDGSPKGFYERLGFVDTGTEEDGETVLKMTL